jgi:hypothetical protein
VLPFSPSETGEKEVSDDAPSAHVGPHVLPWWLELVAAAIIGAALLFGVLLVAGQTNLFSQTGTERTSMGWMSPELQSSGTGRSSASSLPARPAAAHFGGEHRGRFFLLIPSSSFDSPGLP